MESLLSVLNTRVCCTPSRRFEQVKVSKGFTKEWHQTWQELEQLGDFIFYCKLSHFFILRNLNNLLLFLPIITTSDKGLQLYLPYYPMFQMCNGFSLYWGVQREYLRIIMLSRWNLLAHLWLLGNYSEGHKTSKQTLLGVNIWNRANP